MEIYSVKLLLQYTIENESRKIYEESTRLFHAKSYEDAFEKAENYAVSCLSYEYTNIHRQKVKYGFYDVIGAFSLFDDLNFKDGTEVFSVHFELKNSDNDPIENRYECCSIDDMYILRNIDFERRN